MSPNNIFYLTVLMLVSFINKSSGINCYYCNSVNNSACIDPNLYEDEVRSRIVSIVNCETAIPSPVAQDFFCRKIVQTIFHPNRDSELRVTRGCGWVRYDKECYTANNADHLETVCQCFHDHCNGADSADPSSSTILFLMFAACLYFYR